MGIIKFPGPSQNVAEDFQVRQKKKVTETAEKSCWWPGIEPGNPKLARYSHYHYTTALKSNCASPPLAYTMLATEDETRGGKY